MLGNLVYLELLVIYYKYMISYNTSSADNQQERSKIQSWYITGFVDGEGSFHIAIAKSNENRFGLRIIPEFHISQNVQSKNVLEEIREALQCGYIQANHGTSQKDHTLVYVVRKRCDLVDKVIPFFEQYTLRTEKHKDFMLFKQIVLLMEDKIHYQKTGLKKIIQLAYQMNGCGCHRKVSKQWYIKFLISSETTC